MKGFPREKNCVIMDNNIDNFTFPLDENKNISVGMAEKHLSELFDEFMEPVQLRHNFKNKENRYRLVGHMILYFYVILLLSILG